jgi:hypothetical protein
MLVPSIVTLAVATITALFSINTEEEVFKVTMGFVSILSALLTLIFVPWTVKVIVLVVPILLDKFNYWSLGKPNN